MYLLVSWLSHIGKFIHIKPLSMMTMKLQQTLALQHLRFLTV